MLFIRDQCGILLLRVWWLATNTLYAKFFVVYYWHEKTIDKCSQIFHGWNIDVAKEYQIKTLQSIVNMFEIYYIYMDNGFRIQNERNTEGYSRLVNI